MDGKACDACGVGLGAGLQCSSLVPLAPHAAAVNHEPVAETANLTITPGTRWRISRTLETLNMSGALTEACGVIG